MAEQAVNLDQVRKLEEDQEGIGSLEQADMPKVNIVEYDEALAIISEAGRLTELSSMNLGEEGTELASNIVAMLETLKKDINISREQLLNVHSEPFVRGNYSDLALDLDLNGAMLFISEYGQVTPIIPQILQAASGIGLSEPMFSNLHMSSPVREEVTRRKRHAFKTELSVNMRCLSYKGLSESGLVDRDRSQEEDRKRINENERFLSSLSKSSIDLAFEDPEGVIFDETSSALFVGYLLVKEDKYNEVYDSFRESVRSHYDSKSFYEADITSKASKLGNNGDILRNDSALRLYQFVAVGGDLA